MRGCSKHAASRRFSCWCIFVSLFLFFFLQMCVWKYSYGKEWERFSIEFSNLAAPQAGQPSRITFPRWEEEEEITIMTGWKIITWQVYHEVADFRYRQRDLLVLISSDHRCIWKLTVFFENDSWVIFFFWLNRRKVENTLLTDIFERDNKCIASAGVRRFFCWRQVFIARKPPPGEPNWLPRGLPNHEILRLSWAARSLNKPVTRRTRLMRSAGKQSEENRERGKHTEKPGETINHSLFVAQD